MRGAMIVWVTWAAGCEGSEIGRGAAAVVVGDGPAADWVRPDVLPIINLECNTGVNVGFDENERVLRYYAESTERATALADCEASQTWWPESFHCRFSCQLDGVEDGCDLWVDLEAYTELRGCRCTSYEHRNDTLMKLETIWGCDKYARLDVGQRVECGPCVPVTPSY